ncbi:Uncharacterised protein g10262 [Pycnogonum litorale]
MFSSTPTFLLFLISLVIATDDDNIKVINRINVVPQLCAEARQTMDSFCETRCEEKSWKTECLQMCMCSKPLFLTGCEKWNWSELKQEVFANVCPYLSMYGYTGSFLRLCKGDDLKKQFCSTVKQSFPTPCTGLCSKRLKRINYACSNFEWNRLSSFINSACPYLLAHKSDSGPFRKFCKVRN